MSSGCRQSLTIWSRKTAALIVYGTDDLSTTAFTPFGIESLKELMPLYRRQTDEG
jgi:hypothetical protein